MAFFGAGRPRAYVVLDMTVDTRVLWRPTFNAMTSAVNNSASRGSDTPAWSHFPCSTVCTCGSTDTSQGDYHWGQQLCERISKASVLNSQKDVPQHARSSSRTRSCGDISSVICDIFTAFGTIYYGPSIHKAKRCIYTFGSEYM